MPALGPAGSIVQPGALGFAVAGVAVVAAFALDMPLQGGAGAGIGLLFQGLAVGLLRQGQQRGVDGLRCRLADAVVAQFVFLERRQVAGEALLLVRVYRSLDALVGTDDQKRKAWMNSHNHALGGVPLQLVQTVTGLVGTLNYLDGMRAPA